MTDRNKGFKNVILLFMTCFVFTLWVLKGGPEIEKIKAYISADLHTAIICCVALIVLKCLISVIPTTVVYLMCGCILPTRWAFFACMSCTAFVFSVSFFRYKYKTKANSFQLNGYGSFLYSLFLHCIRIIPSNTAGRFLSKSGVYFPAALSGAVIGATPSIILSLSVSKNLPKAPLATDLLLIAALLSLNGIHCIFCTKLFR